MSFFFLQELCSKERVSLKHFLCRNHLSCSRTDSLCSFTSKIPSFKRKFVSLVHPSWGYLWSLNQGRMTCSASCLDSTVSHSISTSFSTCIMAILEYWIKQYQAEILSMQSEELKEILRILIYKEWHWAQSHRITWNADVYQYIHIKYVYIWSPPKGAPSSSISMFS